MAASAATPLSCRRLAPAGSYLLLLAAGLLLLLLLSLASITVGSRELSLATVADAFFAFDPGRSEHLLLRHLRLPRALLAVVHNCSIGTSKSFSSRGGTAPPVLEIEDARDRDDDRERILRSQTRSSASGRNNARKRGQL